MGQLELFSGKEFYDAAYENPMVRQLGKGPAGRKCGECEHLFQKVFNRNYYKCGLRANTNGAATDHRLKWHACRWFQEGKTE